MTNRWFRIEDNFYNLDHISGFTATSSHGGNYEVRAILNYSYADSRKPASTLIGQPNKPKEECFQLIHDILAGKYDVEVQ